MKMGFERYRRIIKECHNVGVTDTIGGKQYYFRSKFEHRWAQYLELLKKNDEIIDWEYEPDKFYFREESRGPWVYIPDFKITDFDGSTYYQETKGYHDGTTNSKFQRMAKYYPDVVMELVLQRIPKKKPGKGINRRKAAERYVRRIIDASEIFKQIGLPYGLPEDCR